MGKLIAELKLKETAIETRRCEIATLTSKKFEPTNVEQLNQLKKYLDHFQMSLNTMYLYRGLRMGLSALVPSLIFGRFLPDPINYCLTTAVYFGVVGFITNSFQMTDFYNELKDIKTLYNWCLKSGKEHYDLKTPNIAAMKVPEVSYMMRLIAPVCEIEFMRAWNTAIPTNNSLINIFWNEDQNNKFIEQLKSKIEHRAFDLRSCEEFAQAIEYFSTNPKFRTLLGEQIQQVFGILKSSVSQAVALT